MALAIDGTASQVTTTAGSSASVTLSTTFGYGKCVIFTISNGANGISSITSSHLTFGASARSSFQFTTNAGWTEEWVADVPATPLSNEVITIHYANGNFSYQVTHGFCVSNSGNSAGLGFDSGGPVSSGNANASAGATMASMTTVNPNALVFGLVRQNSADTAPTAGTGWTAIIGGLASSFSVSEYKLVSSTGTYTVASDNNADSNASLIDAITANVLVSVNVGLQGIAAAEW